MDPTEGACWCGNTELEPFSDGYLVCNLCGTLVSRRLPGAEISIVRNDTEDFYGRNYWFSHQVSENGNPDIVQRTRNDLSERCIFWLRALLKYRLPPARLLELGSAHGAFVALLRWAGYEATGLELSPSIVEYARETFGIPVLLGSVEGQEIPRRSIDIIVLMDVLEHLPNPVATMEHCAKLLKDDGFFLIQTPRYPEVSYPDLVSRGDRFVEMLKPIEHSFLFSERSLQQLFQGLGFATLSFEPSIFSHYDMFAVISRTRIVGPKAEGIQTALQSRPSGRLVQAMLDLDDGRRDLKQRVVAEAKDSADRLEAVTRLEALLLESEADRANRLARITELERQLQVEEKDSADRLESVTRLEALLLESEADRANRLARITELEAQLRIEVKNNAVQQESVTRLEALLLESEADRANGLERIAELEEAGKIQERRLEEERLLRGSLSEKLTWATARMADLEDRLNVARQQVGSQEKAINLILQSRAYRILRRAGKWSELSEVLSASMPHAQVQALGARRDRLVMAVDMTPVVGGGDNGGAKTFAIELVEGLAGRYEDWDLVLLTTAANHSELSSLESGRSNLSRRTVAEMQHHLLSQMGVRLLFCPFGAPTYHEPGIPTICVLHDIQYQQYPQFFSDEDRSHRDLVFQAACVKADALICDSEFVTATVLQAAPHVRGKITTIPIRIDAKFGITDHNTVEKDQVLKKIGVVEGRYLLYPANFWPHKSHQMLLTAFGMFRARSRRSDLKLVLTGAPVGRTRDVDVLRASHLGDGVVFAGYVSSDELAVLLAASRGLVFPSLYEGFGMPVLEALNAEKPILCSDIPSLREIAGEAACYFDPRKPREIAAAIEKLESDSAFRRSLTEAARNRLRMIGSYEGMLEAYHRLIMDTLRGGSNYLDDVHGVYEDGWCGALLSITYEYCERRRDLNVVVRMPESHPEPHMNIDVRNSRGGSLSSWSIQRGETLQIEVPLPVETSGLIEIRFLAPFVPGDHGLGADRRVLSCLIEEVAIRDLSGPKILYGRLAQDTSK